MFPLQRIRCGSDSNSNEERMRESQRKRERKDTQRKEPTCSQYETHEFQFTQHHNWMCGWFRFHYYYGYSFFMIFLYFFFFIYVFFFSFAFAALISIALFRARDSIHLDSYFFPFKKNRVETVSHRKQANWSQKNAMAKWASALFNFFWYLSKYNANTCCAHTTVECREFDCDFGGDSVQTRKLLLLLPMPAKIIFKFLDIFFFAEDLLALEVVSIKSLKIRLYVRHVDGEVFVLCLFLFLCALGVLFQLGKS